MNTYQSTILNSTYTDDTILSLLYSPYQVASYVTIGPGVTFAVENGVEIIFTIHAPITCNNCILNVGCYTDSNFIDTSSNIQIGLASDTMFTHIHYKTPSTWHYGSSMGISVKGADVKATFCNTKFENLDYGIAYEVPSSTQVIQFDNCEFTNLYHGAKRVSSYNYDNIYVKYHQFNNSWFHDVHYVLDGAKFDFVNCHIEEFDAFLSGPRKYDIINVYDSHINGGLLSSSFRYESTRTDDVPCLGCGSIIGNIIANCKYGVSNYCSQSIKYNSFFYNYVAVKLDSSTTNVTYNNFWDNEINVEYRYGGIDQLHLGYNYWGSDEPADITDKILDECNGFSKGTGYVKWWPYYLTFIDFENLETMPSERTIDYLNCPSPHSNESIPNTTILAFLYTKDYILKAPGPYYIVNKVYIDEHVTMFIENGVELIFMDDYHFKIRGNLIIGCDDIDTTSYNNHGLENPSKYSYIHSYNGTQKGTFVTGHRNASTIFCNVQFQDLQSAIITDYHGHKNVTFDHCEFDNVQYGTYSHSNASILIQNCYFHNLNVILYGSVTYYNCKFESYDHFSDGCSGLSVYNSELIGHNVTSSHSPCVVIYGCYEGDNINILVNNTISNCPIGIKHHRSCSLDPTRNIIRYNTIRNNAIGIEISSPVVIEYNNFINNVINLQSALTDDSYWHSYYYGLCKYNYWGNNDNNQTEIASRINDACDSYSNGLVIWWPYYIEPINFQNVTKLPAEHTINTLGTTFHCKGYDWNSYNEYNISASDSVLDAFYFADTTLTINDSPYFVVQNVMLGRNATLYVENGVEIIFMGHYRINVSFAINIGCASIRDVSIYNNRGLIPNISTYTYIHSNSLNRYHHGSIFVHDNGHVSVKMCNVLVESLEYPITYLENINYVRPFSGNLDLFIKNCEFKDNTHVIMLDSWQIMADSWQIYSSIFYDSTLHYESFVGSFTVENVYMNNISQVRLGQSIIRHSQFVNMKNGVTLDGFNNIIQNSTFTNCSTAIHLQSEHSLIEYNLIENNIVGIDIVFFDQEGIHFNNFINNKINIQATTQAAFSHNCSHNYFGSCNQTVIAQSINDICNGNGTHFIQWWPYYDTIINNSQSLPLLHSIDIAQFGCKTDVNGSHNVSGTVLLPLYLEDTILKHQFSPYYIVHNVFLVKDVTMTIENGVEIIFTSHGIGMNIQGIVNASCNETEKVGVFSNKSIHIHSESNNQHGYFIIATKGKAYFCNVLFESLFMAIRGYGANIVHVEHCDFRNNSYGLDLHRVGTTLVDNCIFEDNENAVVSYLPHLNITNSKFVGRYSSDSNTNNYACIALFGYSSGYFMNNQITNCYRAVSMFITDKGNNIFAYGNNLANNYIGLQFESFLNIDIVIRYYAWTVWATHDIELHMSYNNFINNSGFNIYSQTDRNVKVSLNYWGTENITDPQIISDTIYDYCDHANHTGIMVFSPWLQSKFTNMQDLPAIYSIDTAENTTYCNYTDTTTRNLSSTEASTGEIVTSIVAETPQTSDITDYLTTLLAEKQMTSDTAPYVLSSVAFGLLVCCCILLIMVVYKMKKWKANKNLVIHTNVLTENHYEDPNTTLMNHVDETGDARITLHPL